MNRKRWKINTQNKTHFVVVFFIIIIVLKLRKKKWNCAKRLTRVERGVNAIIWGQEWNGMEKGETKSESERGILPNGTCEMYASVKII